MRIYSCEEAFGAADKTSAAMRKAISAVQGECAVFIVSQRTSSIMNADKIIVLDEGRVVGVGTHKELMKSCLEYREIYLSQKDEEVEA